MSAAPAPGIGNPAYINRFDFEPIYQALFDLLDGALTPISQKWGESSRLLRHWSDTTVVRPAMFLAQLNEVPTKRVGQIPSWTLDLKVYIYCQAPNDSYPTSKILNPLIGAVRAVLQPDKSGPGRAMGKNTLGGLCDDVYISGKIETDEGTLGALAIAVIPIRILEPHQ